MVVPNTHVASPRRARRNAASPKEEERKKKKKEDEEEEETGQHQPKGGGGRPAAVLPFGWCCLLLLLSCGASNLSPCRGGLTVLTTLFLCESLLVLSCLSFSCVHYLLDGLRSCPCFVAARVMIVFVAFCPRAPGGAWDQSLEVPSRWHLTVFSLFDLGCTQKSEMNCRTTSGSGQRDSEDLVAHGLQRWRNLVAFVLRAISWTIFGNAL